MAVCLVDAVSHGAGRDECAPEELPPRISVSRPARETGGLSGVLHAFTTFFDHLRAIAWTPVLLALVCQLAKMLARTRAWRNVLFAAYPNADVRWRSVFGAYVAGAGVNAVVPVRGGDLLKLSIVKRRVEGATYATLASSLLVETVVDALLSGLLLLWALQHGVLPGLHVLNRLPAVDWFWLFRHPRAAAAAAVATLVAGFATGLWAARRIEAFRERVAQGVSILRTPGRYLRSVVVWQLADWVLRLAAIYFFLRAFHVAANVDNALRVQVTHSLSTIVPLTPAGNRHRAGTDRVRAEGSGVAYRAPQPQRRHEGDPVGVQHPARRRRRRGDAAHAALAARGRARRA